MYTNKPNVKFWYRWYHLTKHEYVIGFGVLPDAGTDLGTGSTLTPTSSEYQFTGKTLTTPDGFKLENMVVNIKKEDVSATKPIVAPPSPILTYKGKVFYTKGTNVNMRSGPGTSYALKQTFAGNGSSLGPVVSSVMGLDGILWHMFGLGYVRSDFCTETPNINDATKTGTDTKEPLITIPEVKNAGMGLWFGLIVLTVGAAAIFGGNGKKGKKK